MGFEKLLFIPVLTFLLAYLLYRLNGGKKSPLNFPKILIGYALKVFLACLYGYVFLTYYGGDDTWVLFNESVDQTALLHSDPETFLRQLGPGHLLEQHSGTIPFLIAYLYDLEHYLQIKLLAILNLVTGSDYYLDAVLLNGIFFPASLVLYNFITKRYGTNSLWLYISCFCFIPPLFWLSGIRSEGFIFLFTVILIRSVARILDRNRFADLLIVITGFAGLVIFRPQFALLLIPALLVWMLIEKGKRRPGLALAGVYGIFLLIFFGSSALSESGGFPGMVAAKQRAFFALKGNTRFALDSLEPQVGSYLKISPQALNNTLLRPYPWEAKGALQWFTVLENGIFLIAIALLLTRLNRKAGWQNDGFFWAMLALFLSSYLFIGLTVPFPGAIVRYKCIPELLLLITLTGMKYRRVGL